MTVMPDLFGETLLPGLALRPSLVSEDEETELVRRIDGETLAPFRFQGWLGKQLTCSFGWTYDFDHGRLGADDPLPDWLLPLRERAGAFAGLSPDQLEHALLIRYDPGAGIGWHKDRPAFEHVIGISLGTPCAMRLRRPTPGGFDRRSILLDSRSAYHLSGEARHHWEHSIAPLAETRWSITFRSLAAR